MRATAARMVANVFLQMFLMAVANTGRNAVEREDGPARRRACDCFREGTVCNWVSRRVEHFGAHATPPFMIERISETDHARRP